MDTTTDNKEKEYPSGHSIEDANQDKKDVKSDDVPNNIYETGFFIDDLNFF